MHAFRVTRLGNHHGLRLLHVSQSNLQGYLTPSPILHFLIRQWAWQKAILLRFSYDYYSNLLAFDTPDASFITLPFRYYYQWLKTLGHKTLIYYILYTKPAAVKISNISCCPVVCARWNGLFWSLSRISMRAPARINKSTAF